jgi:carbamoyltransferase
MNGALLGPSFADPDIYRACKKFKVTPRKETDDEIIQQTARLLKEGNVVGWFQGRMEFGPRALGNRSIIADPRDRNMQKKLNLKIKFRESFRPFAPAVLREDVAEWFDLGGDSPYMQIVADVLPKHRRAADPRDENLFGIERLNLPRSSIPAVTHVDYSARIQTVHADTNARFHALLTAFKAATGCPVLVNTSFNVRGEPIVCTPEDAFRCFMGNELDVLVIGNCVLQKTEQDPALKQDYSQAFEAD